MQPKTTPVLALIAIACAMLAGLAFILKSHAQQAESYPTLSSFRTLPQGTSVFYEALRRTAGMTADRNTQPLGTVRFKNAAVLFLDIRPIALSGDGQWFDDMEELAGQGNRVIVGLSPHRPRFLQPENDPLNDALKQWGIRLAFVRPIDLREGEEQYPISGWPMYFAKSDGWRVTRQEDQRAVAIERTQGKGTIVLLANSYLLSNAAMVEDRQTTFLAKLIGPVREAIFDETHFGIEQTGSVAALARRYRLQGLLLGLAVTASLFIWKSAWGGFQPARPVGEPLVGEDSSEAFVNLLRRNIKPDDVLSTCVEAWRKMYVRKAGPGLSTATGLAESGRKSPAQTYAQIQQILGAKHNPS